MIKTAGIGMALVAATLLVAPTQAHAVVVPGTTASADRIVVGNFFAFFAQRPMACIDPAVGETKWVILGPLGGSLDADYQIMAGLGDDTIEVLRGTQTITGDCAAGPGAQWNALSYGIHFLDVYGEGDNDRITGGRGETAIVGGSGSDILHYWSDVGAGAWGGIGNDDLIGHRAAGDYLSGDADSDCLQGSTGYIYFWKFSCGSGYDYRVTGSGQQDTDDTCDGEGFRTACRM